MSQQQQRKPFNYLHKKKEKHKGSTGPSPQQHKQFSRLRPDASIHVPPIAMYLLGGLGVVFGFAANCWQWFTTFSAMMDIMTPNGTKVNNANQPLKYVVAAIIATAMQFGILLLLFKIDTRWKKNTYGMNLSPIDKMKGYGAAAVEVVQHVDVVTVYGLLSFGLDSLGDYTFIAGILQGLDFPSTLFVTFIYAASLYALSTVAFVRSVEYIAILAWFLLCAALMWPFNQLHMGFIGLVVAMVVAILILLWVRWLVSVMQRKLSGVHLTRRQWAEMAMGVEPGEIVEQDADDPAFNPGANVQHAPWTRALAHVTALQPYYQQHVATLADEEDLPDTVIEENGMYFSDHFMPALAPMLGQIILVCGNRNSGKSNLLGVAAEEIGRYEEAGCPPVPILFIDMEDQWSPLANRKYFPRGFLVGDPSLQFVQKIPLRHFAPVTLDNAKSVGRKLLQHCLQFVFTMRSYPTFDDAVLVLCELIRGMVQWEEERENKDRLPVVIFFDEANKILPQEERYSEIVDRRVQEVVYKTFFGLVNRGRNYGFSVWFVTQRIQQIHKSLLQAAYKFLFFQGQKVDLEQYQIFGLEPEDVLSLQQGECYVFTPQVIGFRCYMRARISPHLGHTPGLDQLRAYQQQVRPIETLNGSHISGQVPDPIEKHITSNGMREQIAYIPGGQNREPVSMGSTSSATTGPEPETHPQPPQRSGFEKLEINGIQVTAMQKLAYELHMQGHQTGVALATAMTMDGRFGKIDNNVSYRLRNELAAKGLISLSTKRSQEDA